MQKNLSGKVALVTGGSRGIGAGIARELAAQGADVAIAYGASAEKALAVVAELEAMGVRALAFKADQGNVEQVTKLVGDVATAFGGLDILINNAGVIEPGAIDATEGVAAFDRQYAINARGVFAAIRAASRIMRDAGRIISISSVSATRVGAPGLADYAATKAAVEGYTRGAARDLAAKNITVNVVAVGPVDTDMNPKEGPFAAWLKSITALGRYARVEEVAAAVAFLASPTASFVTGSVMVVDGGQLA